MWYVSLNGCGHQSPVQMIRLRLNATAKPGNFVRIRPICCAAVSWAGRWRRLDRAMVRIAKHGNHRRRCRDNTSHRRNSKEGAASVCLHAPGLPQDGLINHRPNTPFASFPGLPCVKQTSRHAVANLRMPSLKARYAPGHASHRSLKSSMG
jgi:hypothetical protein